jgi:uncharacterized protein YndB with AHSA1/START domain
MAGNTHGQLRILGSLRSADGSGVVRIEDRFDTEIDDLWSALTEPSRLATWIGDIEGERRPDGEFRARYFDGWSGTGRVETCEPPHRLVLRMRDADPQPGQPAETMIDIALAGDGGQTNLIVEEQGLPLPLLAAYGTGVQMHVERLADHVAGRGRRDMGSRWDELFPAYSALAADVT